jgi:hypothetical protein
MRVLLLGKVFVLILVGSLIYYALTPIDIIAFLKILALGLAISIIIAWGYPEIRGIKRNDLVATSSKTFLPSIMGRIGQAMSAGKKNDQIRIKFNNGEEALGIIESYAGWVTPARVRLLYEEKLVEQ